MLAPTRFPTAARLCRGAGLAALALVAWLPAASAQSLPNFLQEWRWVEFGPESGLPPGEVVELAEVDSVVWIRTGQTVAWYDGFRWFPALADGAPLPAPVTSLAADSTGGVLVAAGGRVFQGGIGGLRELAVPEGSPGRSVVRAFPAAAGGVLLVAAHPAPAAWILRDGELRTAGDGPPIVAPHEAWITRKGTVWINTVQGFVERDGDRWVARGAPPTGEGTGALVILAPEGRGYAFQGGARDGGGAYEIEPDGGMVPIASEGHNRAWSGDVAADGLMLVAYETGDLRARTADGWTAATLPAPRAAGVRMVRFARNGDLWIATKGSLHLFRRTLPRWQVIRRPFPEPFNRVNAILLGRDTVLWLGTDGGVFQHRWGTVMTHLHESAGGMPLRAVTGLAQDGEGSIWATSGSGFEGAARFADGAWKRFGADAGLDVGFAHRVQTGPDGSLWFSSLGTSSGGPGGLYHWKDGKLDDVFTRVGLERQRVYGVAWGADATLWVAAAQGLVGIRGDRVSVQARLQEAGDGDSAVFDLALDPLGRPWVAFRSGRGIGYLADDARLALAPTPGLGPTDRVWSLLFDPEGRLWVGTEAGVLIRHSGLWARLDESVGLPTANVWPVALHPDAVLIGTRGGGLVALNRRDMGHPAPRVALGMPAVEEGTLRLSFAPLAYWGAQPARSIESRHRVDGGPWSPFSVGREVWLPGLDPGPHTVEVQAKGLYGQLSEPAAASVTVPPPIFLQPVVLVPVSALAMALVSLLALVGRRRREHRKSLALSEARMRALVESAPEAIGILDADAFRYIDANERAIQMFGVRREDISKVDPFSLMPEDVPGVVQPRQHIMERFQRALQGEMQVLQWMMVDRHGERIPCELRLAPLPSEGARLLRVSALDIRDRLAAEARRDDLEEQLRQSQKLEAVGQLTGGVAHDFNNLLTVIRGNLELLQESGGLTQEDVELVDAALQAANRSARLTQRLLAFSRRQRLAPRRADLRDLGVELSDLLPPSLGEAYPVTIDVPDGTWPVTVDWVQLESALLNLAVNSRDAMPGGGSIQIQARNVPEASLDAGLLRDLAPRDYVCVCVSDTGRGMPPEVVARAFDPFFTTKEVGKGTGLGLSMVYGFASQSGGTARIESTVGAGTTVSVYLPRDPGPDLAPPPGRTTKSFPNPT